MAEGETESNEDLLKLLEQEESMRTLIDKTNYNYNQMKIKMDRTYSNRQHLVRETKPIKEIVDLYPGLYVHDLVRYRIYSAFHSLFSLFSLWFNRIFYFDLFLFI